MHNIITFQIASAFVLQNGTEEKCCACLELKVRCNINEIMHALSNKKFKILYKHAYSESTLIWRVIFKNERTINDKGSISTSGLKFVLGTPCLSLFNGVVIRMKPGNRDPRSQQVWHDKDHSMPNGHKWRALLHSFKIVFLQVCPVSFQECRHYICFECVGKRKVENGFFNCPRIDCTTLLPNKGLRDVFTSQKYMVWPIIIK